MKRFIKFFTISITSSGLILTIAYLFSFTPLDSNNGSFFSNGFITGLILICTGLFRIRSSQNSGNGIGSYEHTLYGGAQNNPNNTAIPSTKKIINVLNADALGFLLAGVINLILSFLF